jgi:hypothetical protein
MHPLESRYILNIIRISKNCEEFDILTSFIFVDSIKNFNEIARFDSEVIEQQLEQFNEISHILPFMEHQTRVNAFLTCCQLKDTLDSTKLKEYINAYGLFDEQMKIITECADTLKQHTNSCKVDLQRVEDAQANIRQ